MLDLNDAEIKKFLCLAEERIATMTPKQRKEYEEQQRKELELLTEQIRRES